MEGERAHTHARKVVAQAESVQDPRRVRADLDARADLAERAGALVDVDVEPRLQQRERGGQAADAAADDSDRDPLPSDVRFLTDHAARAQPARSEG
jgi:hypothetical protein